MKMRAKGNSRPIVVCERIFFEGDWISDDGSRGRGSVFGFLKKDAVEIIFWNFIPYFQYKYAFFLPFVISTLLAKILHPATAQELIFHEGLVPIRSFRKLVLQIIIILQLVPLNFSIQKVLFPCVSYERFLAMVFPFARKKLFPVPPSIDHSVKASTEGFPDEFFELNNRRLPIVGIIGRISTLDPIALCLLKELVVCNACRVVYAGSYSRDLKKLTFPFVDLGVVKDEGLRAFIEKISLLFCPFVEGVSLKNTTATTALSFGKPIFSYFLGREIYRRGLPFQCDQNLLFGIDLGGIRLGRDELSACLRKTINHNKIS
jgi:hypothetical protein